MCGISKTASLILDFSEYIYFLFSVPSKCIIIADAPQGQEKHWKLCTLAYTANLGVPYILRIKYEFDLASLNRINC